MKKLNILSCICCWLLIVTSACNKAELTNLNINPNTLNTIDPEIQLAKAQLLNESQQFSYEPLMYYVPGYVQHFAAITGVLSFGDKYFNNRPEDLNGYYSNLYTNSVVNLTDIISKTGDNPSTALVHSIARMMRVFVMHRLTDMYGDIVYTEGGAGFSQNALFPKFDAQQDVYANMLKELDEAATALKSGSGSLKNSTQDLFYGGNRDKWVKFGYSMMLRLAMRMSKVDAGLSAQWVNQAISGGLMTSNDDNAIMQHTDGPNSTARNPMSLVFESVESEGQKLSKTLIDFLKDNNDPRLLILSMGIGAAGGPYDTDPTHQKGMPNGYDAATILGYEGLPPSSTLNIHATYSTVNTELVNRTAPSLYLSYAEVELLLAEAAQLGFTTANAATHYNNGVRAAMTMYDIFDPALTVDDNDINSYLSAHPYNPSIGLKMIGDQYWLANFTNPVEAWANYRRSGFPELVPVNFPGTNYGDQIPSRFIYPTSEAATNAENYQEAISRQGPDTWETKIWWDK
ncbi:MAG: SusD/RagB family nutrient-binding outer membrane lipoprotein [Chitinophagaceae bacterium]|nr:SusD/RagB family nutrient-binding outer membrane lipoprotein [Chitinophagaceae bacterium]